MIPHNYHFKIITNYINLWLHHKTNVNGKFTYYLCCVVNGVVVVDAVVAVVVAVAVWVKPYRIVYNTRDRVREEHVDAIHYVR